jgi:hypothetical protein
MAADPSRDTQTPRRARVARSPARRIRFASHLRAMLAPAMLALVPLFWVIDATYRASIATLGRDQGIFQYVAWALSRGEVDYRDLRDVNGPLTHMIHWSMLVLGGADEHRFRVLDLLFTGVSFALVGACLPGLVRARGPRWVERAAWAAAAWVILSAQYAMYSHWDQAQRESFCDWFLLPAVGLLLLPPATVRAASWRISASGGLAAIACFGKPTFALFAAAMAASLLFDDTSTLTRPRRIALLSIGGAIGAALPIAFVLRYGDVGAYLQIVRHDVPAVYRFIWAKSAREIFSDEAAVAATSLAVTASACASAMIAARALPRRALIVALLPICAIAGVLAQQKGFAYHFHPMTAATWLAALVISAALWERFRHHPTAKLLALGASAAIAWQAATALRASPHLKNVWVLALGDTAETRSSQEYLDRYRSDDFDPWEMRQAARLIREATLPGDRVQSFGMDPYLLFLAQRRSATPYIYAYDLDATAALAGGFSNTPTKAQTAHIGWVRDTHERDLLGRVGKAAPAAFVFMDHAPLIAWQDAVIAFHACCAESAAFVDAHYRVVGAFGPYRVYLRSDLRALPAGPPPPPAE